MYFSFSIEFGLGQQGLREGQPISKDKDDGTSIVTWNRLRELVKNRDGVTCQYCGKFAPDGAADHVIPLARGGTDSIDNLIWSCSSCNQSKGTNDIEDWKKPDSQPSQLRIEIVPVSQSEPTVWDIDSKRIIAFAQTALTGQVTPDASNLSRRKFGQIRNEALRRGLLKWKHPTCRSQGVEVTPEGKQVFTAILAAEKPPGAGGQTEGSEDDGDAV